MSALKIKKGDTVKVIAGKDKACFAVTEPNVGLDTLKLKTKATRDGDRYILSGQKIWISTAQVASKMLILARTTPLDQVARRTEGLSLFYTDLDRRHVDIREIPKMGRSAVDSNELFIDRLPVPVADRIGEEGRGFEYILHGMNPERILIAAEGIGLGRAALRKASAYAKDRIVFDRPIGENQAIQHPLAARWMELEATNLMVLKAASLYDKGEPCGVEANAAKYLAGEAAFKACETALMSHGGMGYAKEFHVERYLRESLIVRIAVPTTVWSRAERNMPAIRPKITKRIWRWVMIGLEARVRVEPVGVAVDIRILRVSSSAGTCVSDGSRMPMVVLDQVCYMPRESGRIRPVNCTGRVGESSWRARAQGDRTSAEPSGQRPPSTHVEERRNVPDHS